jgi:urease accessory protein
MENLIIHTKSLSRFLQILDSSFPNGGFIHSFGLESYTIEGLIKDNEDLYRYLENFVQDQYIRFEYPFVKKIFDLLDKNRLDLIIKEDEKFTSMQNYAFAKASCDIGKNYLKHLNFDIKKDIVKNYFNAVVLKKSEGCELLVLSAYAYELNMDYMTFLLLWSKKNLINIALSILKISRIKPSQIQQILFKFDNKLEKYIKKRSKNISNFNPLFEEVIFKHYILEPKMFAT